MRGRPAAQGAPPVIWRTLILSSKDGPPWDCTSPGAKPALRGPRLSPDATTSPRIARRGNGDGYCGRRACAPRGHVHAVIFLVKWPHFSVPWEGSSPRGAGLRPRQLLLLERKPPEGRNVCLACRAVAARA